MGLPLYLAMTGVEIRPVPHPAFLMPDHRTPPPSGFLPVVTDRHPLTQQAVEDLCRMAAGWPMALLDFERPPTRVSQQLLDRLPCPAAVPPGYPGDGPVFLPPQPLCAPLEDILAPWQGREVWLDAALQRQTITVTAHGVTVSPLSPNPGLTGGFYDECLRCRFLQDIRDDRVVFTLFDTPESLQQKLDHAAALGVTRAVGLWQELGEKGLSAY